MNQKSIQKARAQPPADIYEIATTHWEFCYSYITVPGPDGDAEEFIHLETLELHGQVLRPARSPLKRALVMIASEKPLRGDPIPYKPVIGNVVAKRTLLDAYVPVPAVHLDRLVTVAAASRRWVLSELGQAQRGIRTPSATT